MTAERPPRSYLRWIQAARMATAASLCAGLAACGGGGGSTAVPDPVQRNEAAVATAQPGELLDYVKRKLAARGPQGGLVGDTVDMPVWLTVAWGSNGPSLRMPPHTSSSRIVASTHADPTSRLDRDHA